MPKVSIIIPVYNVEKYLRQCLDSIVNQTLKDIEIICIDDCSDDNSLNILEEYAKNDKRFVIIKQETNQGQGVARNIGIEKAQGEYIGFVDPDDWVEIDMYEKLFNQAKSLDSDVVICDFYRYIEHKNKYNVSNFLRNADSNYNVFTTTFPTNSNLSREYLNSILLIAPCFSFNKIYKKLLLKTFDIKFSNHRCYEDIEFILNIFFNAKNISYMDDVLYFYRYRQSSTLRTCSKRFDILMEINAHIANILVYNKVYNEFKHNFNYFVIANFKMIKNQLSLKQKIKYYFNSKKYLDKLALNILKKELFKDILQRLFSITNEKKGKRKYKVIRILGIKIKHRKS